MSSNLVIAGLLWVGAIAAVLARKKNMATKPMRYPLAVNKVTSGFGIRKHPVTGATEFHNGIDLAGAVGTVIAAPFDGTVSALFSDSIGGNQLVIIHDNGFKTGYAHLSRYAVTLNQRVKQSEIIAYIGDTGRVTGPHLHLTLRDKNGQNVDPQKYLI